MAPFLHKLFLLGGGTAFVSPLIKDDTTRHDHMMVTKAISSSKTVQEETNLAEVISLLGGSPTDLLRLDSSDDGIRGVYLNKGGISKGDIILEIPLSSCLRDDGEPPSWLEMDKNDVDDSNNDSYNTVQIQGWVTRLTAQLLELQSQCKEEKNDRNDDSISLPLEEGHRAWLNLLPDSLRNSLPVYWSESAIQKTNYHPLELAVDAAFFARAAVLSPLAASGRLSKDIEQALDLVQTRACRCATWEETEINEEGNPAGTVDPTSEERKTDLRVMVPIFDMINHHYEPNAEFARQGDSMVVRACQDLEANQEVLISYGTSTMPVWRCLFSYGFVPSLDDIYEHNEVEIFLNNQRFEISPTEIPFELVQYQAKLLGLGGEDTEDIEFTPEIGNAIVQTLKDYAKDLQANNKETEEKENEGNKFIPEETMELINQLKESHRRTILACAGGLQEYLDNQ